MPRFFVGSKQICGDSVLLEDADLNHLKVLRLRPEETFIVCDGVGTDHICRLDGGNARILETRPSAGEPTVRVTLYAAYAKSDRVDHVVQKGVELGAVEMVLFPSARCVSRPGDPLRKLERWRRIALEAAKQSGRGIVPEIRAADTFKGALEEASRAELPLFLYECACRLSLRAALLEHGEAETFSIVTGPEGGFDPDEVALAQRMGLKSVTIGPRILRCETAPLAALTAILFNYKNFE